MELLRRRRSQIIGQTGHRVASSYQNVAPRCARPLDYFYSFCYSNCRSGACFFFFFCVCKSFTFLLEHVWKAGIELLIRILCNILVVQLSEISIPHYLTASIFTAQSRDIAVFHRNVRLLIVLCITSGICRSKSCMVKLPFFLVWSNYCFFFIFFHKP